MFSPLHCLVFQHLGFVHCPIREHCPAWPGCTDALVERLVSRRGRQSWQSGDQGPGNHLRLLLLGANTLASDLSAQVSQHFK